MKSKAAYSENSGIFSMVSHLPPSVSGHAQAALPWPANGPSQVWPYSIGAPDVLALLQYDFIKPMFTYLQLTYRLAFFVAAVIMLRNGLRREGQVRVR